jgi:hypothetical protein
MNLILITIDCLRADHLSCLGYPKKTTPNLDYLASKGVLFSRRLLITIPNTGAINDRLRLLFGRFPKQWILHPSEHLHFWTVTDFLFLCRQLGFKVGKVYGLYDPYYNLGCLKLWKYYPKLFTRYIRY